MDNSMYVFMREVVASWGLIYMLVMFVAVIIFTFRPGSKKIADDVSQIPFREDK
ncbi:MAG: cbb3-type cytochrome c oxidase subunit 3 [Pseudomonadota bacterium]